MHSLWARREIGIDIAFLRTDNATRPVSPNIRIYKDPTDPPVHCIKEGINVTRRTVLDVGNCAPDHAAIRRMLTKNFDVEVLQTDGSSDTLETLRSRAVDLVLINRKLDMDYSDGVEILKTIKADPALAVLPVMIVTNYEEHQEAAMAIGAVRGFGKLSLNASDTLERLRTLLGDQP